MSTDKVISPQDKDRYLDIISASQSIQEQGKQLTDVDEVNDSGDIAAESEVMCYARRAQS